MNAPIALPRAVRPFATIALLFSTTFFRTQVFSQSLIINEFVASNSAGLTDEAGDFEDWVEIFNPGATPVNIGGWYVSDAPTNLTQWQIPATDSTKTTIAPGGYLILWFDNEPLEGVLHCRPKLSADGEAIFLTSPDGATIVDSRTFLVQIPNVSEGRKPNGGPDWDFYAQATPGAANNTPPGVPKVAPVTVSLPGGKYAGAQSLALACATPGANIRYTTNGSVPTATSMLYTGPLLFDSTTVLRARAFLAPLLPSDIKTESYFFGLNHSFPVVSVVFEHADFFDPATGIYPNFLQDLSTTANIELFETSSQTAAFNQLVETEIQGTASATQAQKSLDIKPKASLGGAEINYKIFPDLPFDKYKRFVLRNAGQDWNVTMFRDELVTSLAGDLSDLPVSLRRPEMHLQAWRPAVVYYNGQYWGIHNLRERMNRFYVEQRFDLPAGSFDMIENFSEALSGDSIEWFNLVQWLQTNSFTDDASMAELKQRIDYQNFLDYCAFYVYIDNEDWPGNNVRRFRERQPGAKWRWISYDFDYSFGLYQPWGWNTGDASPDALGRLLNPFSQVWPNPDWATLLFRKCWENAAFRRDFVNRTADFMNTVFAPGRVGARLNQFKNLYQPEIAQHFIHWTTGYYEPYWLDNIEKTRRFANERPAFMRQHVNNALTEVTGTANLTLTASPLNGGAIEVSTIGLKQSNFPWTGQYFTGVKIPLKAVPNPGYRFVGWSDANLGVSPSVEVTLVAAKSLTARFEQISNPPPPIDYCEAGSQAPWLDFIKKVKIGPYERSSDKETYTHVAGVALTMLPGISYPITLTSGYSFETFNEYWRIWIDFDRDGQFGDNEMLFQGIVNAPAPANFAAADLSGVLILPASGTVPGETRMRIGMKRGDFPTACELVPQGEFEDYTINIGVGGGTACSISASVANVLCHDNGTASLPGDDRFSFVLNATGVATSGNWSASIGNQLITGQYGQPKTSPMFAIAGGNLTFNVTDVANAACTTTLTVQAPAPCSAGGPAACMMIANATNATCNNNGTPANASDDTWTFVLTVSGSGIGTGWTATIGNSTFSGAYGTPKTMGNFPISGGDLAFAVRDLANANCTANVTIAAPASCSSGSTTGYCNSRSNYPWHDWISQVTVGSLNRVSLKNTYNNYTNTSVSANLGQSLPLSLRAGFSFTTYEEFWKIWVDWNRDGQFDEASETAFEGIAPKPSSGTTSSISGSLTVPFNAQMGGTRMRVSMKRGAFPAPCETFANGEVEDYTFIVLGQQVAPGQTQRVNGALPDADELPAFLLYPNPAADVAMLNLKTWLGKPLEVQLLNALGVQASIWKTAELKEPLFELDLRAIQNGQYFLNVTSEGQRPARRVLIVAKTY